VRKQRSAPQTSPLAAQGVGCEGLGEDVHRRREAKGEALTGDGRTMVCDLSGRVEGRS
jgi:hypothetical protein